MRTYRTFDEIENDVFSEVAGGIFNLTESFSLIMHFNWRKCQQRRTEGVLVRGMRIDENVWSMEMTCICGGAD